MHSHDGSSEKENTKDANFKKQSLGSNSLRESERTT